MPRSSHGHPLALPALIAFSFSLTTHIPAAPARPGTPGFASLWPRGAQAGTSVTLEISGQQLIDPRSILVVSTDKIRCTAISPTSPPTDSRGRTRAEPNSTLSATLEIAPDCPIGLHGLRILTAAGLSDLRIFSVGRLPELPETESRDAQADSNGSPDRAEPLPLPTTLNGQLALLSSGMESDCFRVTLTKGAVFTAELEAARLNPQDRDDGFEASLSITSPDGKPLVSSGPTPFLLTDPFLSFTAPADGTYTITVAAALPPDTSRRVPYRLHLSSARRPTAIYPPGGNPGSPLEVSLIGLPDTAPSRASLTLPAESGTFPWFADPHTPSPNTLRILPGPSVLESEPNNSPDAATPVPDSSLPPFAVNGILASPGDSDSFRFSAKKDLRLNIRAFSQALGSPADLRLSIAPANGKGTERSDDSTDDLLGLIDSGTIREKLDPALAWKAPADGDYILTISDSRSMGGPDFVYRVECTAPADALLTSLAFPDNQSRTSRSTVSVARGNRFLAMITTSPAPGSDPQGEWELRAENLPPGVHMLADPFPASTRRVPVMFSADANATVSAASIRLLAAPRGLPIPQGSGFRQSIPLLLQGNDALTQFLQPALSLAVADPLPFSIEVSTPPAALARDGELDLDVSITRLDGFNQPLEILLEQPPRGVIGQQGLSVNPGVSRTTFRLSARSDAAPGHHRVALTVRNREGDNRSGAGRMWAASAFFPLEISDPWLRIKFARTRIEQGRSATLSGTIEKLRGLPAPASASLIRLPRGISLTSPVSISDSGTVSFSISAAPDALVGSYSGLACELSSQLDGRSLKQIAGYGSLRIDPARAASTP
jgi:hypothetical protein